MPVKHDVTQLETDFGDFCRKARTANTKFPGLLELLPRHLLGYATADN
jgi:hypothetical protein